MQTFNSWGNYPAAPPAKAVWQYWRHAQLPADGPGKLLAYGGGRSYGDSCLNDGGTLVLTSKLNHVIEFDRQSGRLRSEAGITLAEILAIVRPVGWFLPVTPGTQFATLGGAIANDVHGKNHHAVGTFGCHVTGLELLRSDGSRQYCSADSNEALFRATIGGLGLTGLVTWAEISLKALRSPFLQLETIPFHGLDEFMQLSGESGDFEHAVAWIDCLSSGKALGRGHFFRANHAADDCDPPPAEPFARRMSIPAYVPEIVLNRFSVSAFNSLYFHSKQRRSERVHYVPFFYPLDAIQNWNRIYGRAGFLQHQSVVPMHCAKAALTQMLGAVAASGQGSFLSVLKVFGDITSPGMMSFPRPGVTLALDFPLRGKRTLDLLENLDRIVCEAGGAIYPAKDARMSSEVFDKSFPRRNEFEEFVDPGFSSSFWRRVTPQSNL